MRLKHFDEVVTKHLLEVSRIVVHHRKVLLVHIQVVQREGNVRKAEPEAVVSINLLEKENRLKTHDATLQRVASVIPLMDW